MGLLSDYAKDKPSALDAEGESDDDMMTEEDSDFGDDAKAEAEARLGKALGVKPERVSEVVEALRDLLALE